MGEKATEGNFSSFNLTCSTFFFQVSFFVLEETMLISVYCVHLYDKSMEFS